MQEQQGSLHGSCWAFEHPRYGHALHFAGTGIQLTGSGRLPTPRKVFPSTTHLSPSPEASIYQLMGISYLDQLWCKWHMHSTAETIPAKAVLEPHQCSDSCWLIKSLQRFEPSLPLPHPPTVTTPLQQKELRTNTPTVPVQGLSKSLSLLATKTVTAGVGNIAPRPGFLWQSRKSHSIHQDIHVFKNRAGE